MSMKIGVPIFVVTTPLTIIITFITISYKAYHAAIMNPASALKLE